jgi:hypothetical protein
MCRAAGGSDSIKEQAELGRLMDDVNETAQRIKTRLTNLDAAIKEKAPSDSDANARIKRTLHASSQKKVTWVSKIHFCTSLNPV